MTISRNIEEILSYSQDLCSSHSTTKECVRISISPPKKPMRREALSPFFFRRVLLPLQKLQSLKVEIVNINDFAHVVKIALQLYDFEDFAIVTDCSFYRVFKVSPRWGFRGLRFGHIRFAHGFSKLWKHRDVLWVLKLFLSDEICIRMIWHQIMFRLHWKSNISRQTEEMLSYSQDLCSSRSTTKAAKTYGQGT